MFWQKRFHKTIERMRGHEIPLPIRLWDGTEVYLAGCAHGFANHWLSVHQSLAVKAGTASLPLTRDYIYSD